MKKQLIPLVAVLFSGAMYAQVGIGTLTPHGSAQLEVKSGDKGILIPRVSLQSPTDEQTMAAGNIESLLVFNTSTTDALQPGYYYWFDAKWQSLATMTQVEHLVNQIEDHNTTNVSLTVANDHLVLTDSEGNEVSVVLSALQNEEVITTLTKTASGVYVYISEDATSTTIDVPADVIANFQEITNVTEVRAILETIVRETKSNVLFDGSQFTYVDQSGQTQIIDLTTLVQGHQKTVSVTQGTHVLVTPTVNGDHTDYKIDVPAAQGPTATSEATYGVVKEAAQNPTVRVNAAGELFVDRNQLNDIKMVQTNYTIEPSDGVILANANDATLQIELPSPVGAKGRKLTVKKSDNKNTTYVNVVVAGGATIEGESDLYTSLPYSGWDFMSDGAQWKIVNKF